MDGAKVPKKTEVNDKKTDLSTSINLTFVQHKSAHKQMWKPHSFRKNKTLQCDWFQNGVSLFTRCSRHRNKQNNENGARPFRKKHTLGLSNLLSRLQETAGENINVTDSAEVMMTAALVVTDWENQGWPWRYIPLIAHAHTLTLALWRAMEEPVCDSALTAGTVVIHQHWVWY